MPYQAAPWIYDCRWEGAAYSLQQENDTSELESFSNVFGNCNCRLNRKTPVRTVPVPTVFASTLFRKLDIVF